MTRKKIETHAYLHTVCVRYFPAVTVVQATKDQLLRSCIWSLKFWKIFAVIQKTTVCRSDSATALLCETLRTVVIDNIIVPRTWGVNSVQRLTSCKFLMKLLSDDGYLFRQKVIENIRRRKSIKETDVLYMFIYQITTAVIHFLNCLSNI